MENGWNIIGYSWIHVDHFTDGGRLFWSGISLMLRDEFFSILIFEIQLMHMGYLLQLFSDFIGLKMSWMNTWMHAYIGYIIGLLWTLNMIVHVKISTFDKLLLLDTC